MEPAAWLPQRPKASAICLAERPKTLAAAAAAPNTPQVAVGWKPRA